MSTESFGMAVTAGWFSSRTSELFCTMPYAWRYAPMKLIVCCTLPQLKQFPELFSMKNLVGGGLEKSVALT